jgi:uncharacterized membrane protein
MATLTVFKFENPEGARNALDKVLDMQNQELISVIDAATVSWPADKKKPKQEELHNLTGAGAASGAFWGFLFGLIFLIPWFGLAVGAASGALSGSMTDIGINDEFINEVRQQVTPGTSALFLMSRDEVVDKVRGGLGEHGELIASNLSDDEEAALIALLADD